MTDEQRSQLEMIKEWCDEEDKSTPFMLQYMQDFTGLSFDEVLDFCTSYAERVDE